MSCFVPCAILGTLAQLRETRCCVVFGAAGSIHYISIFCIFSFSTSAFYNPRPTCHTSRATLHPPHSTLFTPRSTFHTSRFTFHILHPALTLDTPRFAPTFYTSRFRLHAHAPRSPLSTPRFTLCTPSLTLCTSFFALCTHPCFTVHSLQWYRKRGRFRMTLVVSFSLKGLHASAFGFLGWI